MPSTTTATALAIIPALGTHWPRYARAVDPPGSASRDAQRRAGDAGGKSVTATDADTEPGSGLIVRRARHRLTTLRKQGQHRGAAVRCCPAAGGRSTVSNSEGPRPCCRSSETFQPGDARDRLPRRGFARRRLLAVMREPVRLPGMIVRMRRPSGRPPERSGHPKSSPCPQMRRLRCIVAGQ